jgi:hypothetical protein
MKTPALLALAGSALTLAGCQTDAQILASEQAIVSAHSTCDDIERWQPVSRGER